MANGHTYFRRKPGRRDEERKTFADLMRKVEAIRLRDGMSKAALAAELETTTGAIRNWMTGRAISQKQTVNKIAVFLAASIISAQLGAAFRGFGLRSNTRICLDTMWPVWLVTAPSELWHR